MKFYTNSGNLLEFDLNDWSITGDKICKVIGETPTHYVLENKTKQVVELDKSLIRDNNIPITNEEIELTESLYNTYFFKKFYKEQFKIMNELFRDNIDIIFKNRKIVLSRPEYYLIRPDTLTSGSSLTGGFNYCLGSILDSIENGSLPYYEELCGHKKMYLYKIAGSFLSGTIFGACFWSEDECKIFNIERGSDFGKISFGIAHQKLKELVSKAPQIVIAHQDRAIRNLLNEIQGKSGE